MTARYIPTQPFRLSRLLQVSAVVALVLSSSTLGIHGQPHRARLSLDLLNHEARHAPSRARVIVRGTRLQIEAMASRHQLRIARFLDDSAVLLANGAELSELAADSANEILSGDVPVIPFMTVSKSSTGSDQVQAGTPGLLGIGAIAGANGQGVTVAVIDSGIASHPA